MADLITEKQIEAFARPTLPEALEKIASYLDDASEYKAAGVVRDALAKVHWLEAQRDAALAREKALREAFLAPEDLAFLGWMASSGDEEISGLELDQANRLRVAGFLRIVRHSDGQYFELTNSARAAIATKRE